jgi:hypothetical protein
MGRGRAEGSSDGGRLRPRYGQRRVILKPGCLVGSDLLNRD